MLNTCQISISTFSDAHCIIKFSVRHKNNKKTSPHTDKKSILILKYHCQHRYFSKSQCILYSGCLCQVVHTRGVDKIRQLLKIGLPYFL